MRYFTFNESGTITGAINDDTVTELPAGAIEVTLQEWEQRFNLAVDVQARALVPLPAPQPVDALAGTRARLLPELRRRRDAALNVLDGLQADALTPGAGFDTSIAQAIKTAKQACRDLPALDVSAASDEAGIRGLYLAEWRRIAALVPPGVRTAFAAVLA